MFLHGRLLRERERERERERDAAPRAKILFCWKQKWTLQSIPANKCADS